MAWSKIDLKIQALLATLYVTLQLGDASTEVRLIEPKYHRG